MTAARPALFDAHLHVIDPRFPLVANAGYLPPAFDVADYRAHTAHLDLLGGAVVSGSFQAFDQTYLLAALAELGPAFVGVTQLPASAPDEQVLALAKAGVRAVRFNVRRGGSETLEHLDRLARRVHDLAGWHAELYVDARDLPDLLPVLTRLPQVSVDHLGLSRAGLPHLLRLVEHGARVKATGFSRGDLDVPAALRAVAAANPAALMAGTDLPGTRAPRPFTENDLDLIAATLDADLAGAALHRNALALYRPAGRPTHDQGWCRRCQQGFAAGTSTDRLVALASSPGRVVPRVTVPQPVFGASPTRLVVRVGARAGV